MCWVLGGDGAVQLRRSVVVTGKVSIMTSTADVDIVDVIVVVDAALGHVKLIHNKHLSGVNHSLNCCSSCSSKPPAGQLCACSFATWRMIPCTSSNLGHKSTQE